MGSLLRPALLCAALLAGCSGGAALTAEQAQFVEAAKQAGASEVRAVRADDGGMRVAGVLEGRKFSLVLPWRWNHQMVYVAGGYGPPGLPVTVPDNLLANDEMGLWRVPYGEGFGVAVSANDKSGMAVQSEAVNAQRLKQFVDRLGATRSYIIGGSMGGNVTMALIEKWPDDFAGALAGCGVVSDWTAQLGYNIDVRAAYEYFTRGTAYALPGEPGLERSAVNDLNWAPMTWLAPMPMGVQLKRIVAPMVKLFEAAQANPGGAEQRMIENIAAVSGAPLDPAAFITPVVLVAFGMDDLNQTFGGSLVDNTAKVYSSPQLTAAENAALNAGILRIKANPKALEYGRQWYTSTGRFKARLLTIVNEVDPLAPGSIHEPLLRDRVQAAGNTDNLVQRAVPARRGPTMAPLVTLEGLQHCSFKPEEIQQAWDDLRAWVEQGRRPQ